MKLKDSDIFNFKNLNFVIRKKSLIFLMDSISTKSEKWTEFVQTNLLMKLRFLSYSIDLCKGILKNSILKKFYDSMNNSLILGLSYKKKLYNFSIFLKNLTFEVFVLILKLNNKFYSTLQLKTIELLNYFLILKNVFIITCLYLRKYSVNFCNN